MNPKELNHNQLIRAYKNAKDILEVAIFRRELWDRGFEITTDGHVYFPECYKPRKRVTCALCLESIWCHDYESGGLGKGTMMGGLSK